MLQPLPIDELALACMRAGGRGKSTLAKVLFNRLAGTFDHSAFVEIQEGDGADKNAQHLAAALKGLGATGKAAEGAVVLSSRLKDFVRGNKVLLVLDNVWTASQLTALLPTVWGPGSTVIITSRSARLTDCDVWRQVGTSMRCNHVFCFCACDCDGSQLWTVHYVQPRFKLDAIHLQTVVSCIMYMMPLLPHTCCAAAHCPCGH
jgi:hypothetical protein